MYMLFIAWFHTPTNAPYPNQHTRLDYNKLDFSSPSKKKKTNVFSSFYF